MYPQKSWGKSPQKALESIFSANFHFYFSFPCSQPSEQMSERKAQLEGEGEMDRLDTHQANLGHSSVNSRTRGSKVVRYGGLQ